MRPERIRQRATRPLAAWLLTAAACQGTAADCVQPPCALPLALELTATAAGSGAPVAGASFRVGGAVSGEGPCAQGKCVVMGGPGTYEVDVRAPGYQTVHTRVTVAGTLAECGCPTVIPQRLTVVLPAAS